MALPKPGQRVHLAFSESVRTDLRLLECDEAVLEDIINKGCAQLAFTKGAARLATSKAAPRNTELMKVGRRAPAG